MKILNKLTVEQLEQMSDDKLSSYHVLSSLFDSSNNTSNFSHVNPNIFDYHYNPNDLGDPYKYGAIALHLSGDIRTNYTDYYFIPMDEFDLLIQDIAEYEVETEEEVNIINIFLKANNISQTVQVGSRMTIDYSSDWISIDDVEGIEGLVSKYLELKYTKSSKGYLTEH